MPTALPAIYLVRHGETEWSLSGQHTGRTDLPLTERGQRKARQLRDRLQKTAFARVFTSPLQRAALTCDLAGFKTVATMDPDLIEWDYGQYEGLRSVEIHQQRPDWNLFRDGCPHGESPEQIGARADLVVQKIRKIEGNVLLFSSGHFLRVLAARWLGFVPGAGRYFLVSTASISILGYEHTKVEPVIQSWNDVHDMEL
jgi:broad specificity phosphatase PhoE